MITAFLIQQKKDKQQAFCSLGILGICSKIGLPSQTLTLITTSKAPASHQFLQRDFGKQFFRLSNIRKYKQPHMSSLTFAQLQSDTALFFEVTNNEACIARLYCRAQYKTLHIVSIFSSRIIKPILANVSPPFTWRITKKSQSSMQTALISYSFWLNLEDASRHSPHSQT